MTTALYPPLHQLRSDLFGEEAPALGGDGRQDTTLDDVDDAAGAVMPAHLFELVRLRNAVRAAHPPMRPAAGQVRRLDRIPGPDGRLLGRSCAVLLRASLNGKRWSGWIVAQEVDYAGERDLVLQDSDGLIAPEAGMVQTWNPVELTLHGDEPILGQLGPTSLGAVMLLADAMPSGDAFVAPRPGRLGAWNIAPELAIVSGTPLGPNDDPRHEYQLLYQRLAQELGAVPIPASVPDTRPRRRLVDWLQASFVRPFLACAALVIVAGQGIWMLQPPQASIGPARVYRGGGAVGQAGPCAVLIRIVFRPDAPYADLVDALRAADATLVSGPSGRGEIWVLPPVGRDPQELASMLRQQRVVEQSDVIEPDRQRCAE